jgi:hypothetical protein
MAVTELDAILARLDRLEAENAALRQRLDSVNAEPAPGDAPPSDQVSRRDLLRRVGTGVTALGIGAVGASMLTLAQPGPVRADGEPITVGGTFENATATTTIHNSVNAANVLEVRSAAAGAGIYAVSETGNGVDGRARSGAGVYGFSYATGVHGRGSFTGVGVLGESDGGAAVKGESDRGFAFSGLSHSGSAIIGEAGTDGIGVEGESNFGIGVFGSTNISSGVLGASGLQPVPSDATRANTGVLGICAKGRGGKFLSDVSQVQLVPSTRATHPTSGLRGDLFVDKSGRLWFCRGGSTWKQLA